MTLPLSGLRGFESALWRRLAGVRRNAVATSWIRAIISPLVPLPSQWFWERLEGSLPSRASRNENPAGRGEHRGYPRASAGSAQSASSVHSASGLNADHSPISRTNRKSSKPLRKMRGRDRSPASPAVEAVRTVLHRLLGSTFSQKLPVETRLRTYIRELRSTKTVGSHTTSIIREPQQSVAELRQELIRKLTETVTRIRCRSLLMDTISQESAAQLATCIHTASEIPATGGEQAPAELILASVAAAKSGKLKSSSADSSFGERSASQGQGTQGRDSAASFRRDHQDHTQFPGRAGSSSTSLSHDDAPPLHPVGLASRQSMPAPDVPISVTTGGAGSMNRVAPPQATPSLPPLVPAHVVQPPAYGLSGPFTRVMTQAEDLPDETDDLTQLADNIKLILQEEARRHGIAV